MTRTQWTAVYEDLTALAAILDDQPETKEVSVLRDNLEKTANALNLYLRTDQI